VGGGYPLTLLLLTTTLALVVVGEAGTGRDEPADHDVLLEAAQEVLLAGDRGLGEDAGGLLEGGRRDEGLGRQRGLGDTQQDPLEGGGHLAFLHQALVLLEDAHMLD